MKLGYANSIANEKRVAVLSTIIGVKNNSVPTSNSPHLGWPQRLQYSKRPWMPYSKGFWKCYVYITVTILWWPAQLWGYDMGNMETVLQRPKQYGVGIKTGKCHFLQTSVEFLVHPIDAESRRPLESKVQAITKAPVPSSVCLMHLACLHYGIFTSWNKGIVYCIVGNFGSWKFLYKWPLAHQN